MPQTFVFNKSIIGASHIRSGKPCQDFSMSYQNDDVKILVVCDGHGGSTYFRSDVGSKIAAEVCIKHLVEFAQGTPVDFFMNESYALPAKPQRNPFVDADGNRVRYEDLDESQQQYAKQAQAYVEAEGRCIEQQAFINKLLTEIYSEWRSCIVQDEHENPFSSKEISILNGNGIEKAYGCTLLAYMQTPHYWLSFHIGDGKIYICDENLTWKMPVPEDCACFLNYTTSLCDNNPVDEFRFAFNGTRKRPLAVVLCSDGLDGSLRNQENIIDFYEQIIGLHIDGDDINDELTSYLPRLSELGNKDDISLAGLMYLPDASLAKIKKLLELKKESRELHTEYRTRKQEIDTLLSKLEALRLRYERHKDTRFMQLTELDEMRQVISGKETAIEALDKTISDIRAEINEVESLLKAKETSFEDWRFTTKNRRAEIEESQNELTGTRKEESNQNYTNW